MNTPIENVLAKAGDHVKKTGKGYMACCPAHDDQNPSLSITAGDDGKVLLYCHSQQCKAEDIVNAWGLTMADLWPAGASSRGNTTMTTTTTTPPKVYATQQEAISALELTLGSHACQWTYQDAQGQPIRVVLRWNKPDGSKDTIRPIIKTPDGWCIQGATAPELGWTLYRLPDLLNRPSERVYICEGEKAADAAQTIGLLTTTSPQGSNSASKADWSPLAGRNVVIVPDNDEPGQKYANTVASILLKLDPPATVRIISLPDLSDIPGGDMADFVKLRGDDVSTILAEIGTLATQATALTLADVAGLADTDELEDIASAKQRPAKFKPFPVDVLPEPVASFIDAAAKAIGCDPSYIALPMLVQFASAIGNSRRIQLKQSWAEPAIIWAAIIGESGTTKSPALEIALRPVKEWQERSSHTYKQAMLGYQCEIKRYEAQQKSFWRRPDTGDNPPDEPIKPIWERSWLDDATIEATTQLLEENERGILLIQDELVSWLDFDRYSKGKGSVVGKWLEMYGGRSVMVDRKASGPVFVPRASVSIIGGIQPGILQRVISQEHRENGLLPRIVMASPPPRPKVWSEADVEPQAEAAMVAIYGKLRGLQPARNAQDDPEPAILKMTPEAKAAWISFYNRHNQEQASLAGDLAAAWSKLEGYAARLALVVQLIRWAASTASCEEIDKTSIDAGVSLSNWFCYETRRVYAMLESSEEDRQRQQKIAQIERLGGSVSRRDWQRICSFKKSGKAYADLNELVKAGYGKWSYSPSSPKGGRPSEVFTLHLPQDTPPETPLTANVDDEEVEEI